MSSTGSTILVVDDDVGFCAYVASILEDAGLTSRRALTGQAAIEAARAELPALVLLDVNLPTLSGYEVCRALRQEWGDELPIILVSGVAVDSFDRVAGLLLGGDDYLVKPFAPDELLARASRLIDRSPRATNGKRLTPREFEVLGLLADGLGPTAIGRRLLVSPRTVGTHVEHIYRKLGVHTRAEAVVHAYRHGLVSSPLAVPT